MKTELMQTLTSTFEGHAQNTEAGSEYWLARDLHHLLGYAEWVSMVAFFSLASSPR